MSRSTLRATFVYFGFIEDPQADATSPARRAPPHILWLTLMLGAALGTALLVGVLVVLGVNWAHISPPWMFVVVFVGAMAVRRLIDLFRQRR